MANYAQRINFRVVSNTAHSIDKSEQHTMRTTSTHDHEITWKTIALVHLKCDPQTKVLVDSNVSCRVRWSDNTLIQSHIWLLHSGVTHFGQYISNIKYVHSNWSATLPEFQSPNIIHVKLSNVHLWMCFWWLHHYENPNTCSTLSTVDRRKKLRTTFWEMLC